MVSFDLFLFCEQVSPLNHPVQQAVSFHFMAQNVHKINEVVRDDCLSPLPSCITSVLRILHQDMRYWMGKLSHYHL